MLRAAKSGLLVHQLTYQQLQRFFCFPCNFLGISEATRSYKRFDIETRQEILPISSRHGTMILSTSNHTSYLNAEYNGKRAFYEVKDVVFFKIFLTPLKLRSTL